MNVGVSDSPNYAYVVSLPARPWFLSTQGLWNPDRSNTLSPWKRVAESGAKTHCAALSPDLHDRLRYLKVHTIREYKKLLI